MFPLDQTLYIPQQGQFVSLMADPRTCCLSPTQRPTLLVRERPSSALRFLGVDHDGVQVLQFPDSFCRTRAGDTRKESPSWGEAGSAVVQWYPSPPWVPDLRLERGMCRVYRDRYRLLGCPGKTERLALSFFARDC